MASVFLLINCSFYESHTTIFTRLRVRILFVYGWFHNVSTRFSWYITKCTANSNFLRNLSTILWSYSHLGPIRQREVHAKTSWWFVFLYAHACFILFERNSDFIFFPLIRSKWSVLRFYLWKLPKFLPTEFPNYNVCCVTPAASRSRRVDTCSSTRVEHVTSGTENLTSEKP